MNNYSSKRHLFFFDGHLDKTKFISYICGAVFSHQSLVVIKEKMKRGINVEFEKSPPPGGLFGFKGEFCVREML